MLGIELIWDTIGKLNTMYVVTTDDNLIPLYLDHCAGRMSLGTAGGSLRSCCRTRASGRFSCFLVHVSSCQPIGVQGVSASYDEYTALVKCGKLKVTRERIQEHWRIVGAAVKTDVEKSIKGTAFRHSK